MPTCAGFNLQGESPPTQVPTQLPDLPLRGSNDSERSSGEACGAGVEGGGPHRGTARCG